MLLYIEYPAPLVRRGKSYRCRFRTGDIPATAVKKLVATLQMLIYYRTSNHILIPWHRYRLLLSRAYRYRLALAMSYPLKVSPGLRVPASQWLAIGSLASGNPTLNSGTQPPRHGEREQETGWMIASPLRSRWQAHGELRIAVTSGPRHELLLNVELVLRMVYQKRHADWPAAAAYSPLDGSSPCSCLTGVPRRRPHLRLSFASMAKRAFANPFHDFCQEQRPLLPADLKGSEGAALGPAVAGTLPGCEGQEEGTHTGFHLRPREHALGYPPRLSRRRQWRIS
eukprot:scaffold5944_cov62-Phaeocystis_antarctica.AAC.2